MLLFFLGNRGVCMAKSVQNEKKKQETTKVGLACVGKL
jgi:hypothetical protein